MQPEDLREDLKHEVIIHLLEMDKIKLASIIEQGAIKFYTIRVMLNMIQSSTSKFFRQFRNYTHLKFIDQQETEYKEGPGVDLDKIFGNSREGLYEKDMLNTYVYTFNRNALELSRNIGIPYKTCNRTLLNAKNKVKAYLKTQNV